MKIVSYFYLFINTIGFILLNIDKFAETYTHISLIAIGLTNANLDSMFNYIYHTFISELYIYNDGINSNGSTNSTMI